MSEYIICKRCSSPFKNYSNELRVIETVSPYHYEEYEPKIICFNCSLKERRALKFKLNDVLKKIKGSDESNKKAT